MGYRHIIVNKAYQKAYEYELREQEGKQFASEFKPDLTAEKRMDIFRRS